jgi:hypothetical protein
MVIKYYFLDATDQYNILGMPTSHIQGREALVHKGTSNFELIDVPVVPSDQNQRSRFRVFIHPGQNSL